MFRRGSTSESSRNTRSRVVSFLKVGIGKQVFFENINRALKDLYEDVGMEDMKKAAPRASCTTNVEKAPLPRLGGGQVVITVFCETPQKWRLPYEMQMKIAENTAVGSILQFVLDKYGTIPEEVMSSWRDKMLCSIIEPGANTAIIDWTAIVMGIEEHLIPDTAPLIASFLGLKKRTVRCVSYKPVSEKRGLVLVDGQNEEDCVDGKSEGDTSKDASDSTSVNITSTDERQALENPNSDVEVDQKVSSCKLAVPRYHIRYNVEPASCDEAEEIIATLQNPKTQEKLGVRLSTELVPVINVGAKQPKIIVETESISTYVDSPIDSEGNEIKGSRKILPPDSLDVVKTGSIVKLAYVDRGNIE
jgi:hypothetical protein